MSTELILYTSINDFIKNRVNKITKDKFRYCELSNIKAKQKCNEIEHSNLSFDEKIEEFEAIGYSRTYDLIGASYYLKFPNKIYVYTKCYNIMKVHVERECRFYKPIDPILPEIHLHYDHGLLMDMIDYEND